jgi:polar amino acid transport system substrate-binding protein
MLRRCGSDESDRRVFQFFATIEKGIITMKHIMEKTIAALMLAVLLISLVSCGSSEKGEVKTGVTSSYAYLLDTSDMEKPDLDLSNASGVLKSILDSGVLTIATSPDYPPAEFVTEDGTVYGSEMMLAKYVADCLGVDLAVETMEFSGTFAAVDTGKVDMAFSGYGWKADRAEVYELTVGYVGEDEEDSTSNHTLITTVENEGKFNSLSDFVGAHIYAQAASLQEMYVEDQILTLDTEGTTNLELVSTLDQAILGLQAGKCDAVALDEDTAKQYVAQSAGKFVLTNVLFDMSLYEEFEGNVALAKKGETSLIEAVNKIIEFVNEKNYYFDMYTVAKEQAGIED